MFSNAFLNQCLKTNSISNTPILRDLIPFTSKTFKKKSILKAKSAGVCFNEFFVQLYQRRHSSSGYKIKRKSDTKKWNRIKCIWQKNTLRHPRVFGLYRCFCFPKRIENAYLFLISFLIRTKSMICCSLLLRHSKQPATCGR